MNQKNFNIDEMPEIEEKTPQKIITTLKRLKAFEVKLQANKKKARQNV